MMKNNPFLKPAVIGLVTLLHAGVIALSWNGFKSPEPEQADAMAFVDLGSVTGDDKPLGDGAPAPLEQPEPPQPQPPVEQPKPEPKVEPKPELKPEPKPKVAEQPKVAAVVRNDKPADFRQPEKVVKPQKHEPKPEPVKQPEKPVEKPQPVKVEHPKSAVTLPANANPANTSNSSATANKDAANRAPDSMGGGGSSANSKVPQNGAGDKNSDGGGKKGDAPKPSNANHASTIANGGYISLPNPPYPRSAAEHEEEGVVKLSVLVSAAGKVMNVKVTKSSGSAALDNAGKRAAQSASYQPKKIDGEPVSTEFNTQFTFKLDR